MYRTHLCSIMTKSAVLFRGKTLLWEVFKSWGSISHNTQRKSVHGLRLENGKKALEKYDGSMEIEDAGNVFSV